MTVLAAGSAGSVLTFAIFVDGRKTALFTQLITYLAFVSIVVWAVVLFSTFVRVLARRAYRLRVGIQRRLPTE